MQTAVHADLAATPLQALAHPGLSKLNASKVIAKLKVGHIASSRQPVKLSCIQTALHAQLAVVLHAGFQTETPGASLVLMVTLPTASSISNLSLGYLASYEGMGWASVECLGACTCPLMKIDANSSARASQEHFATVGIERQNEGDGCLIKVANLHQSSALDGGHKFKVSSVAWRHDGTLSDVQQDVALQGDAGLHAHGRMPSVAWKHDADPSDLTQQKHSGGVDPVPAVGHVVLEAQAILESQGM